MCAINKELIQQTIINAKEKNPNSHTMLKSVFLNKILAHNPVLIRQKKQETNSKK